MTGRMGGGQRRAGRSLADYRAVIRHHGLHRPFDVLIRDQHQGGTGRCIFHDLAVEIVNHLAYPMGSVKLLGVSPANEADTFQPRLLDSQQAFLDNGVFTSATVIESAVFAEAVKAGVQALGGSFFRPNLLLLDLPKDKNTHESLSDLIREAKHPQIHPGWRQGKRIGLESKVKQLEPLFKK